MPRETDWTFFTNHGHVIVCLARDSGQPLREVANRVGITERAVQRIVSDLEKAGYLERQRRGRQNRYRIHLNLSLRHRVEEGISLHEVVAPLLETGLTESSQSTPLETATPFTSGMKQAGGTG